MGARRSRRMLRSAVFTPAASFMVVKFGAAVSVGLQSLRGAEGTRRGRKRGERPPMRPISPTTTTAQTVGQEQMKAPPSWGTASFVVDGPIILRARRPADAAGFRGRAPFRLFAALATRGKPFLSLVHCFTASQPQYSTSGACPSPLGGRNGGSAYCHQGGAVGALLSPEHRLIQTATRRFLRSLCIVPSTFGPNVSLKAE